MMGLKQVWGGLALLAGLSGPAIPAAVLPYNSALQAKMPDGAVAFTATGDYATPGECISHAALAAAHPALRAQDFRYSGTCTDSRTGTVAYTYACDGNAPGATEAADRLFAAGSQLYIEKKPVDVAVADVLALCRQETAGAPVAPATRLVPEA